MKKLITLISIALLMVTAISAQIEMTALFIATTADMEETEKKEKATKSTNATEIVVCSVNVHCDNCVARIKKNISFEKGVKDLYISLEDNIVAVKYQTSRTDKKKIQDAIKKLGYEVSEKQSKEQLPDSWKK